MYLRPETTVFLYFSGTSVWLQQVSSTYISYLVEGNQLIDQPESRLFYASQLLGVLLCGIYGPPDVAEVQLPSSLAAGHVG